MKKTFTLIIMLAIIIPQITYASWWNPTSWSIWGIMFGASESQQSISAVSSTSSSSTSTYPYPWMIPTTTQSDTNQSTIVPQQPVVVKTPVTSSGTTLCNGTYFSNCSSGETLICPATGDAYCEVKQQTPKIVVTPVLTPNVSSSVSQDGSTNRSNQITEFQTYLKEREGLYNKIEAISEGVGQELAVETEQDYEGQNQKSIDAGNLELEVVKLQIPKLPDDLSNALVKDKILLGKYADDVSQSASWMAMQIKAKIIDQNDGKDPYLSDNSDYQLTQDRTPQKYQTFHQLFHDDSQQINDNMQYIITATTNNFGSN